MIIGRSYISKIMISLSHLTIHYNIIISDCISPFHVEISYFIIFYSHNITFFMISRPFHLFFPSFPPSAAPRSAAPHLTCPRLPPLPPARPPQEDSRPGGGSTSGRNVLFFRESDAEISHGICSDFSIHTGIPSGNLTVCY